MAAGEPLPADAWMRRIAASLGLTAVLIAAVTWAAVDLSSKAQDEDRRATLTTLAVAGRDITASVQGYSESSGAAQFFAMRVHASVLLGLAEDGAALDSSLTDLLRDEAELLDSGASGMTGFDWNYLGEDGSYALSDRRQALVDASEVGSQWPSDPAKIAQAADSLHEGSNRLAWVVVGLTGIVLLLTLARVVRPVRRRPLLIASWALGVVLSGTAAVCFAWA